MIINSDENLYSIALMLLYVLKDEDTYSDLSHLSFVLDRQNFNKFIDYFGGMTITVPTRDEVNSALKALIYYQSRFVDGKSLAESKKLANISYDELTQINRYARKIRDFFDNLNERSLKNDSDSN